VGAAPREGAVVEMGLAVVARCGSAVRQLRGGDGSVVRRDRRGAIYSRSKAVRRNIPSGGLAGEGGALAGPWWPAEIPVAGRRDGSCRATRRLGRGWVGRGGSGRQRGAVAACGGVAAVMATAAELGWWWS
jgi:hypothetical protein